MRLHSLNVAQRVVVVSGLGIGLLFFGQWVTTRGSLSGWTGYAPLSNSFQLSGGMQPWVRLIVWLALTLVWMVISLVLLKTRRKSEARSS